MEVTSVGIITWEHPQHEEQAAQRSISELFASDGEASFRALETAVLNQIASWHSLVVATGGGVVTRQENWGHMRQG
eukprot:gene15250-19477_t